MTEPVPSPSADPRVTDPASTRSEHRRAPRLPALLLAAAVVVSAVVGVAVTRHRPGPTTTAAWGWGSSQFGELGPLLGIRSVGLTRPVLVPSGTSELVAGTDFVLALAGTRVYAWGRNDHGELADGTTTDRDTPARITLPPVAGLSADDHHVVAVTTTGQVYAWGGNGEGELGDGTTVDRHRPVRVNLPEAVASVGTGASFSLAVTTSGAVWAWGANQSGQLGDGSHRAALRPVRADLPAGDSVVQVAAGAAHVVALTAGGSVLVWGADNRGQLGPSARSSASMPTLLSLPGAAAVTAVAAGLAHSEVVRADGAVWAWGADDLGQLDGRPGADRPEPRMVPLPHGTQVQQLALTANRTVARTGSGRVLAWGATPFGVRTAGTSGSAAGVRTIALGTSARARDVAVGADFALALVNAGTPNRIDVIVPRYVTRAGTPVLLGAAVLDRYGNRLDRPVAAEVTGGTCRGLTCTVTAAGRHRVTLRSGPVVAHALIVVAP